MTYLGLKFDIEVFKVGNKSTIFYLNHKVAKRNSSYTTIENSKKKKGNFIDLKIMPHKIAYHPNSML